MFKLNLKIALRNIWKHKLTNSIKLIGLVVGLCTVVLLVSYLMHELSYDKNYKNANQIYRIQSVNSANGEESIGLPSGLGKMLQNELPEVIQETQLRQMKTHIKLIDRFYFEQIIETDASFLKMFSPTLLIGNVSTVLNGDNEVLLSESFAKKAFPKGNAINQSLQFSGYKDPSLIVGIFKDLPSASHLEASVIRKSQFKHKLNWKAFTSTPQYIQLKEGVNLEHLQSKLKSLYNKYQFPKDITIQLLPITKIHLYSHANDEFSVNSDIKYVYIFSIVAGLILLIAIVNFVNLTVAASLKRGKEIGVKKVMGASIAQLRTQFLSESYIYFIISALLVLILVHDLIPFFGIKLGVNISLEEVLSANAIMISIAIIILAGFIAGLYPAIILSKLMPVKTLKGVITNDKGKNNFKRFLMAFQFAISAFLIVCTLIINDQLEFIRNKNLGFDTEQTLVSSFTFFRNGDANFREEALNIPNVKSVSMSTFSPGEAFGSSSSWTNDKDTARYEFDFIYSDLNFINTLNIHVLQGRDFSANYGIDVVNLQEASETMSEQEFAKLESQMPILLNEAAVKYLNLKNPIGKKLNYSGLQGKVVGVVNDFNGMSLHNKIKPLAIKCESSMNYGYLYIKIDGGNLAQTKNAIDQLWKEKLPNEAPTFQFMDEQIQKLYNAEMRLGNVFVVFSSIAIFLCVIGLFGMVYFDLEQRAKEIALRKILGASFNDLLMMLNGGFVKVVLIANLFIWPLTYFLTKEWLASFSYRIAFSYKPFAFAIALSLLLTILTVSLQAIKILKKSPAERLKYE